MSIQENISSVVLCDKSNLLALKQKKSKNDCKKASKPKTTRAKKHNYSVEQILGYRNCRPFLADTTKKMPTLTKVDEQFYFSALTSLNIFIVRHIYAHSAKVREWFLNQFANKSLRDFQGFFFLHSDQPVFDMGEYQEELSLISHLIGTFSFSNKVYDIFKSDEQRTSNKMMEMWVDNAIENAKSIRNMIFHLNNGLIFKQLSNNKYSYCDDVKSSGICGLLRAIDGFDITAGLKFSTYANSWIRQMLSEAYKRNKEIVRHSARSKTIQQYANEYEELCFRTGKRPSLSEKEEYVVSKLSQFEVVTPAKRENVAKHINKTQECNIFVLESDYEFEHDGKCLFDYIKDESDGPEEIVLNKEILDRSYNLLTTYLTGKEKEVCLMYFGIGTDEPISPKMIAQTLDLTYSRVSQIINKCRKFLASMMINKREGGDERFID